MNARPDADALNMTAHHEAAHAVVLYRARGFLCGSVTIVPDVAGRFLGAVWDEDNVDSSDVAQMEARVVSSYAGAEASRKLGCYDAWECSHDEECAAWARRIGGVQRSEPELRQQAKLLVEQHWGEIVAVAHELLRMRTLDDTEVEIIADLAAGVPDVAPEDLARYRALRATQP